MNISFPTTHSDMFSLLHIHKIRRHGTSTNTADPPPANVTLTDLEPFCWMITSTGYSVRWPHGTRARILRADGKVEGYI